MDDGLQSRPFARVHFPVDAWSRVEVSYLSTNYFNRASQRRGDLLGVGWEGQPFDNLRFQAQVRAARCSSGPGDVIRTIQLGWRRSDRVQTEFGFAREMLPDSVRGAAGVVVNGVLIGRAHSAGRR